MSIKFAICDDEIEQIDNLKTLLNEWSIKTNNSIEATSFFSAEAFSFEWSENKNFDILLFDIQMNGQNGIELAKSIREQDENIIIIFITSMIDYIEDGYDVAAFHYLLKPVSKDKLYNVLDKACKKLNREDKFLLLNMDGQSIKLLQKDIYYIEVFAHTLMLYTKDSSYEIRKSLSEIEAELESDDFIKTHRSYIVGLKHIDKITKTDIILDNNKSVPISRRMYNNVNQAFITYYTKE